MFKQQYIQYLAFLGLSIAVSIGFQMLLPKPFGFIAALIFFIVLPIIFNKKLNQGMMSGRIDRVKIKYHCVVCQNKFNGDECPRCGSRSKRPEF